MDAALNDIVPDESVKPYDMHEVLSGWVDGGEFFEVQRRLAGNLMSASHGSEADR